MSILICYDGAPSARHALEVAADTLEDLSRRRAGEVLADGATLAEQLKLAATSRSEGDQSTEWKTIIDVADELSSELIVCGSHGHTATTPTCSAVSPTPRPNTRTDRC